MPRDDRPDDSALKLAEALASIDKKAFARLCGYARACLSHVMLYMPEYEAKDLVQEALLRTIDKRREWPTGLRFETYLKGCMDSIADEYYWKYSKRPDWNDWGRRQHDIEDTESELYAQYFFNRLRKLLAGDATALAVLNSRLEGLKPAEACRKLGIDAATYEKARKKILRAWESINRDV